MMAGGPFDVTSEQVEHLKVRFTEFANRLLEVEVASHGLAGRGLNVTRKENTPDGGVDAALREAEATDWLPAGDSAWQFKRGDLGLQACADEIEGAVWAHGFLRNGGTYVLALGASLTDQQIETRRKRLAEKAIELGLLGQDDPERIRVYDANQIARWASRYPSLAVSPLLGGPGAGVVDFERWSASRRHQLRWVTTEDRGRAIDTIQRTVEDASKGEIHVQGPSGIGKTRVVMEAVRAAGVSSLVAYVSDQRSVTDEALGYLLTEGRSVILVVDDCPGRGHEKIAERLPNSPTLKLVTMGEADTLSLRSPVLPVDAMPEADIETFLKENYRQLSDEARRLVSGQSTGNVRFAIILAERILQLGPAQAADLIRRNDVEELTRVLLPEGRPFFLSALMALFERVGWDRELGYQLEALARFANVDAEELGEVGRDLEHRGLMVRQGRYRAVAPHPLAVVLAAEAWRDLGNRIVDELLPALDREMGLSLFARVADLGRYEPARKVLVRLMRPDGPFGTLASIEEHGLGRFLTQLAIVAPDETTEYLAPRIEEEPLDTLRSQTRSRRDLVWTLEKLAWHRQTFERAADSLLRLACAENETYGNNATGTWVALFGVALPATAAMPDERIAYLTQRTRLPAADVRGLVVKAAAAALHPYETVMVSGEVQGGAFVEPRGGVKTYQEMSDYRSALLDILAELTLDSDEEVAKGATDALIGAVLPLADDPLVSKKLIAVLGQLRGAALDKLRQEVERLRGITQRTETPRLSEGLDALTQALPRPVPIEQLRTLVALQPWDLQEGDLRARFDALVDEIVASGRGDDLLGWLDGPPLQSAWFLGHQLAKHEADVPGLREHLIAAAGSNLVALAGYLAGRMDLGHASAFDDFLDSDATERLTPAHVLTLTVRGPASKAAKQRVFGLLAELSVDEGAYGLFGWQGNFAQRELERVVGGWLPRVDSQRSYNAIIDWLALWLHPDKVIPASLRPPVLDLLRRRREFPDMANERWDWSRLAKNFVDTHPLEVARAVLDLLDDGGMIGLRYHEESELLIETARRAPVEIWTEIGSRLLAKDWRLSMALGGWFTNALSVEVVRDWVGDSVERARLVASITGPGESEPTEMARFLLSTFGADQDIKGSLAGEFRSGTWTGPESNRLQEQIHQLEGWLQADEPAGVKAWANDVITYLKRERDQALEREAEERR